MGVCKCIRPDSWTKAVLPCITNVSRAASSVSIFAPISCAVPGQTELHPSFNRTRRWPVLSDLEPGDILFIPPMWFHEVHALTYSVSVNGWTELDEVENVGRLFSLRVPEHMDER